MECNKPIEANHLSTQKCTSGNSNHYNKIVCEKMLATKYIYLYLFIPYSTIVHDFTGEYNISFTS